MDVVNIYIASFIVLAALFLLRFISRSISPYIRCLFQRYLRLPVLVNSSHWMRLTVFEFMAIVVYIFLNIVLLCIGDGDLQKRAAIMAMVNLVPTFIGKRINPLAELLGISIPTYDLFHRWTGRVAILHANIHAILILRQHEYSNAQLISGSLVGPLSPKIYKLIYLY